MTVHTISFPNIGIENLQIDRVAFRIFGREIYWYGLLIVFSIVLAFLYVQWRARAEGIKSDDIYDLAIWVVLAGIVGARAYYVLTSLDKYDNILDAFKIWEGGLGFYGCVIGGTIAVVLFARFKKLKFSVLADMIAPTLLLAQAIGRWGNFFNAEAFGSVTQWDFFGHISDISGSVHLPWIMYIGGTPVQPTFLYECVWDLCGFALLSVFYRKKKFNGQIALSYLVWYGFARMLIEGFRTDSLYVGPIRISQLVGALSAVGGMILMILLFRRAKAGKTAVPFARPEQAEEQAEEADQEQEEPNGKTD